MLVSPELASVLATVITRLRSNNDGAVPLVARYDSYEAVTGPPLSHLFQRETGNRRVMISPSSSRILINKVLELTGLRDAAGQPLVYTPHADAHASLDPGRGETGRRVAGRHPETMQEKINKIRG